jgi:hypothetical protein
MTVTEYQPDLFGRIKVTHERLTHEQAWDRFRRRNPWFMPRLAELAYDMRSRGQRFSTKAGFEILRPEVNDSGSQYRLDNSFSALAARRLIEDYPDLDGVVELRRRVSA